MREECPAPREALDCGFEFEFQPLDFVFQPLPWPEALPRVEPFKRWKTVDERRS